MDMSHDSHFQRLREELTPSSQVKKRIGKRLERRLRAAPEALAETKEILTPEEGLQAMLWKRILKSIDTSAVLTLLERVRTWLTPSADLQMHIQSRFLMQAVPVRAGATQRTVKWVAALAVFAILVRLGPSLFIATPTRAVSFVSLLPTRGEVSVSLSGLWQPVSEELVLEEGMVLRTEDGEASILLRDDGVVRLDSETTVEITSTDDPVDADGDGMALTVITGRVWVQGLIPAHLQGIWISTTYGTVLVHEGSVSIAEDSIVDVSVWDRRIAAQSGEDSLSLIAGERIELTEAGAGLVKKIAEEEFEDAWVVQNLLRDAVHRRSIAQMQQERRAARAGILPTSTLYPVKRIAETVDVLLTFNEEARVQKQLQHAESRLDEAAALLAEGDVEAVEVTLADYRDSLLQIVSGSGDTIVQSLIEQSLAEATGELAAVLPDDNAYLIKEAVLEASAGVPDGEVTSKDVQAVLLVDTASALLQNVDEGKLPEIRAIWDDLQGYLIALHNPSHDLPPEVVKEARMLLSEFAFAITDMHERTGGVDGDLLLAVSQYLPPESEPAVEILTEDQIREIVQGIRERIFVFHMERSRINQLAVELKALEGHPDQGRILRRLLSALPDGPENFPELIRREIVRLQWLKAGQE
jgi:hypothetical protein